MHMVTYTVHPEHLARNDELVEAIADELSRVRPPGLTYAIYRGDDGVSFFHMISHDKDAGPLPGGELHSLRAFHQGLRERCVEPPVRTELSLLGAYGGQP